jgi:hypothetical protein
MPPLPLKLRLKLAFMLIRAQLKASLRRKLGLDKPRVAEAAGAGAEAARRKGRGLYVLLGVVGALLFVVLAVGWWLTAPLFIRYAVNRPSPLADPATEVLARGQFTGQDAAHQGSGQALLARLPDGELVLRLENLNVTNGPDLYVLVSAHAAPRTDQEVRDGADLGRLKAPEGSYHYTLPASFDPSTAHSVVIYCSLFKTVFATAPLE